MPQLILLAIGLVTGIFSGTFGLGGGVIIVPALVYFLKYPQHMAQGTSIAMLLPPIGILAAWKYWKAGHVQVGPVAILAVTFVIGAWLGAHISLGIPQLMMKRIFGGLLVLIGLFMVSGK